MKFLMPVTLAAIFLIVGCNRLDGQLNITKDLKLVNSSGDTHILRVGTYTADLSQSTFGKKIILRLNNDNDEKFNFSIPKDNIPSNGTFKFSAAQIGQKVDLSGTVATTSTDSPMRDSVQQCSYTEPYTVCQAGPRGPICSTYQRTVFGTQWTRSFDRTTHQDIHMSIAAAGSTDESAWFQGDATWVQTIVVNQMPCR